MWPPLCWSARRAGRWTRLIGEPEPLARYASVHAHKMTTKKKGTPRRGRPLNDLTYPTASAGGDRGVAFVVRSARPGIAARSAVARPQPRPAARAPRAGVRPD